MGIDEGEVVDSRVDNDYNSYLNLLEKHQVFQKELNDSLKYFKKIKHKNYVLNGKDIKTLNKSFSDRIIILNQSIFFNQKQLKLTENKQFYNLISTHLKIKALETYLAQQKIVGDNSKVNNLINEENKLYRNDKKSLKRLKKTLLSKKYRKSILETWNSSKQITTNTSNEFKNKEIHNAILLTPYYQNYLSNTRNIKTSKKYFRKLINKRSIFNTEVNFNNFLNNIFSGVSNVVSNFIGIFAIRKGKLLNDNRFVVNSLPILQPLDVILEKTPFRLTDKFIPGYWGHAAIYIGNETQLKELGLWNHPIIEAYHEIIKNKHVIIEALRSKVAFNTFKDFTNIDDYAHLRLNVEPSIEKKREMIIRAFAQIGKKYDFGYNVESSKKIICSELHYITFDEVIFNTSNNMGINTISVDQVAKQGLKGGAFYPINLYLDGVKIDDDEIFEVFDQLPTLKNKQIKKLKKSLH
ncbi:MAG: hypothetical protein GQ540_02345 [Lutibacter sp.]|uniref:YiiX/YebB-like N1pC/P60 family cysteine hydrolase n=1 Tax=Lutibacter sp. TaxID=1925666 RepID=UPI0019F4FE90|nr:YiiX/YebB-like N1pC/P60 family cysteine hydrolase [Lutibacter sp.]NOR27349.1 hypothetical protein [Lutibacter sp.]